MLFIVVVAAFHIMFINVFFFDNHGKDKNNYKVFRFNIQEEACMLLFWDGGGVSYYLVVGNKTLYIGT